VLCTGGSSTATATAAAATTAAAAASSASASITRSAHVRFENCNAQQVTLSVTIPRHAFTPTEPVTYKVRLRNTGSTPCGSLPAQQVSPTRQILTVGPCGPLPVAVRNAHGHAVYPGSAVFHCPLEVGFQLGPNATATGTGTWDQSEVLGPQAAPQHAPPGTYRLVVDKAVTVPVTLAPG
jgi:hypothetical protein